ncbi:MAG: hypothetical protein V1494_06565 [Candidatus Diapherotrites archaeon]
MAQNQIDPIGIIKRNYAAFLEKNKRGANAFDRKLMDGIIDNLSVLLDPKASKEKLERVAERFASNITKYSDNSTEMRDVSYPSKFLEIAKLVPEMLERLPQKKAILSALEKNGFTFSSTAAGKQRKIGRGIEPSRLSDAEKRMALENAKRILRGENEKPQPPAKQAKPDGPPKAVVPARQMRKHGAQKYPKPQPPRQSPVPWYARGRFNPLKFLRRRGPR